MLDAAGSDRLLQDMSFHAARTIEGRSSIADLYRKQRCGIYVLHFANGEYYVGQAVDVVRRFAQHKHTHRDIVRISFKRTTRKDLTITERQVVGALERNGAILRNIDLVTLPMVETDFDLIMPEAEQAQWLDDLAYTDLSGDRIVEPDLRRRYQARYRDFLEMPFSDDVAEILRLYVQTSIPAPRKGEIAFWMCSCLPGNSRFVCSRINVGWQTTFDVLFLEDGIPNFRWYMTRELAEIVLGSPLSHLEDGFEYEYVMQENGKEAEDRFFLANSPLVKGGQDQVFLVAEGTHSAHLLLEDDMLRAAVRYFNLGLVKKGPSPWGKYHCLDLADRLLEPVAVF